MSGGLVELENNDTLPSNCSMFDILTEDEIELVCDGDKVSPLPSFPDLKLQIYSEH